MIKKFTLVLFVAFSLWTATPAVYAQGEAMPPTFILLTAQGSTPQYLAQVQTAVTTGGGRITHTFPYQAMIANLPANAAQQIAALPGVAGVFTRPVELAVMAGFTSEARRLAAIWNDLVAPAAPEMLKQATTHPDEPSDTFIAPDLPPGNQLSLADTSVTPGYYQTSEYMAGSVAVGIVLVESNGLVDPSTENWTDNEKQLVFSEIVAALNWWAGLEPRANLSFIYDDHLTNPLPTMVEPITRPYSHQQYWIADAMGALGYDNPSYFTRVRDYNNNLRYRYQTDWAFTIFVVDSSVDSDNRFSDSFFAYAYLGGPFMVMTYGNNGYGPTNMDAVAAHEIGHIFLALDQYYSAYQSCTCSSGYLNVQNQNSQYGTCASNITSIMRGQIYPYTVKAIDDYAAGQLGWRDTDADNILDPLDTELPVNLGSVTLEGARVSAAGTASIIPYPSPNRTSITINKLTSVQYRLNGGQWSQAVLNSDSEPTSATFHFITDSLLPGLHTLEVAAVDNRGNVSAVYASKTITVFDPVDGDLNTELSLPSGNSHVNSDIILHGVAYHIQGSPISQVEYRINGTTWQKALPNDGAFDSNYEPFTITIRSSEPGMFLIEARSTTADGTMEINVATREIQFVDQPLHTIFLPIVVSR